ncbi:hypothetical protein ACQCT6_16455 [Cytobacillus gottheilii]|uniref:hypothetical protein n=1 Tax=Cytobacillus gottheilii TaxID=859144 RepID=UPI003463B7BE
MEEKFLFYKGICNEIDMMHRPSFGDAVLLSKRPKIKSYQRLPLIENMPLTLQYNTNHPKNQVQYQLHNNHLEICFPEPDGKEFFYSILIKEGNWVSYVLNPAARKKPLVKGNVDRLQ